jgi:predicted transcriptional regulator
MEKYSTAAQALDEIANDFGNDPSEILYEALSDDLMMNMSRQQEKEVRAMFADTLSGFLVSFSQHLRGINKQTILKGKKLTEYRKVLRQAIDNYINYLEGKTGGINLFSRDTKLADKILRAPIKEIQTALNQHGGTAIGYVLLNDQKDFAKRVLKARLNKVDTEKK